MSKFQQLKSSGSGRNRYREGSFYQTPIKDGQLHGYIAENERAAFLKPENIRGNQTILRGKICNNRHCSGLKLHTTDIIEVRDYEVSARLEPAVTISIILAGEVRGSIGHIPFLMDASGGPRGYFWSTSKSSEWHRIIQKGSLVRKVNITIEPDFLIREMNSDQQVEKLLKLMQELKIRYWKPSQRILYLAEKLIRPGDGAVLVQNLKRESIAFEIVAEAFEQLLQEEEAVNPAKVGERSKGTDRDELHLGVRIKDYIDQNMQKPMTLETLSKSLGVSSNSLQRNFKAQFGMTVMGYIREQKMIRAKEAMEMDNMTIAQAAYLAGYNSAANFSTAFKRQFGFSPSLMKE